MHHTMAMFALFSLISTGTPGPNNMLLLHSGAYFGWLRTLPHILGIRLGIALLFCGIGFGLANIFVYYPTIGSVFKIASVGYLIYLSYRIMTNKSALDTHNTRQKPFTFLQAALFQLINPKPWATISTSVSLYHQAFTTPSGIMMMCLIFSLSGLLCTSIWASSGTVLRRFLSNTLRFTWFNRIMGSLLIVCVLPMLYH